MRIEFLLPLITQALSAAADSWKTQHSRFLQEEYIRIFAAKMVFYHTHGLPAQPPEPHFAEEITPPLHESFAFFATAWANPTVPAWKHAFETTPFGHVLLLMGRRLTPAGVQDVTALPPLRQTLLQSCFAPFNPQTTVATRAWEKHVARSEHGFYGEVKGNPQQKEQQVRTRVEQMVDDQTWWNVFYHYKHGPVYELRVPTGHGMRWSADGNAFIGFLEPFES